jgi:transposase-like protein
MKRSCFYCGSTNIVKNGKTYIGKSRGKCKDCGKQFVFNRSYGCLNDKEKELISRLLLERISLEGISRVLSIPIHRIYGFLDEVYEEIAKDFRCG